MDVKETYSYFWVPNSHYITYGQTSRGQDTEEITLHKPIHTDTIYLVEIEYTTGNTFGRDERIYRDCVIFFSVEDAELFMNKYCVHYHSIKYHSTADSKEFVSERKKLLIKNHNAYAEYLTSLEDYFSSPIGTKLHLLEVVREPAKMPGLIRKGVCH
jgi:hypothetical protein